MQTTTTVINPHISWTNMFAYKKRLVGPRWVKKRLHFIFCYFFTDVEPTSRFISSNSNIICSVFQPPLFKVHTEAQHRGIETPPLRFWWGNCRMTQTHQHTSINAHNNTSHLYRLWSRLCVEPMYNYTSAFSIRDYWTRMIERSKVMMGAFFPLLKEKVLCRWTDGFTRLTGLLDLSVGCWLGPLQ